MSNQFNADTIEQIRRILTIFNTSEVEIRPHFFLTGGSGTGKTHAIETLCEELEITMFDVNAAQLTKEGTSGNSLSKALTPLKGNDGRPVVCFVDEFDKLFVSGNTNSELAHEVTNGVQNEFLKVLESRTASVYGDYGHYLDVQVSNVLFIFAGAFNGEEDLDLDRLREFGIKTEFLGRVGLTFPMKQLTPEQTKTVNELRSEGYAIAAFTPDEIGKADTGTLEDIMVERGWDYINYAQIREEE